MRIPVLFVTYNRLEYSKKALAALVENAGCEIELNVWDNGSRMDTVTWLTNEAKGDYGIEHLVLQDENKGLAAAMNWFFRKYADAPYVVKVDNDTVLPPNWLADLLEGMELARKPMNNGYMYLKVGAISPTCLRPNGDTFAEWVSKHMISEGCGNGHQLHYNSYVLGTGVLINMDMIRERGLLFEHFPYGPDTPEVDGRATKTCLISGWTAYTRIAADYDGWKFAFYSKVHANLLNLKAEHELSNDYPEYDEELKDARDQGNAWWESVGGLPGVKKYVDTHGGLERIALKPVSPSQYVEDMISRAEADMDQACRVMDIEALKVARALPKRYLTDCDQHELRTTQKWWEERVRREGISRAIFLDQLQARTNEFTEIHEAILKHEIRSDMAVLEAGCGWGRLSGLIAKLSARYVGTDFVEELLAKARETFPKLDFRYADSEKLPFADGEFDAVVSVTCMSSYDERREAILAEMLRVVNQKGFVLFLEETWSWKHWKLVHK